jgi:hypothetical protein
VSASMSAPMSDDRNFHVLEAIPSRLEVSPERPRCWHVPEVQQTSAMAGQADLSGADLGQPC